MRIAIKDSKAEMLRKARRNNHKRKTNFIYQVVIQDEYNDLYPIGFYNNIYNSVDDINEWLKSYGVSINKDDLSSTNIDFVLSFCDLFKENKETINIVIKGFAFERKYLMKELQEKCGAKLGQKKWE